MLKKINFTYIIHAKNASVILAFMLFAVIITSCKKDDPVLKPSHSRYYGLEAGMWREYAVDSVVYRGSTSYANDTLHFFIREEVASNFTDNTGALNYVINTFYRERESDNWIMRYSSAGILSEHRAEMLYNNDRYVKLIFPVIKEQGWNANLYNDEDMDNFRKSKYTAAHEPATVNSHQFDSTLTVQVQDHKDVVFTEFETEQYAAGVGLINHVWKEINSQPNKDKPGEYLNRGWEFYKTLTAYGKE